MGCLERDLSSFKFPAEQKQWDAGSEDTGQVVQTCRGSGRAVVHEALVR